MSESNTAGNPISGVEWSDLRRQPGDSCHCATAYFKPDAPMFDGHFPGDAIVPGYCLLALILDMLQLFGHRLEFKNIHFAKFHQPVRPGDRCEVQVRLEACSGCEWSAQGAIERRDQVVLEFSAVLEASQNG